MTRTGLVRAILIGAGLSLSASCRGLGSAPQAGNEAPGPLEIPVGSRPERLAASADGRLLVAMAMKDHTLSFIDSTRGKEARRVRIPVRTVDASGEPTYGFVSRIALDGSGDHAYAVTTEGQVFRVAAATGQVDLLMDDPRHSFSDLCLDPERGRILLATEGGAIVSLDGAGTRLVASLPEGITRLRREGTALCALARPLATAFPGRGVSLVCRIDLASDRVVAQARLEKGIAVDAALLPDGRTLIADGGANRLLVLAGDLAPAEVRSTAAWGPGALSLQGDRVFVAFFGEPALPILEYSLSGGTLSPVPTGEHCLPPGIVADATPVGADRLAVALVDRDLVVLLDGSLVRPFRGFLDP